MTAEQVVMKDRDREEKAQTFHTAIVESVKGINKNMRIMILSAKQIKDNTLFLDLGYDSFNQYLASPEISVKPATMEKYIKIYEETVGKDKITNAEFEKVPISKLELIAPLKNPHSWIDKARELSYTDLRKNILEKVHGIKADEIDNYAKKVEEASRFCPHWHALECRCLAGVDTNKPVIEQGEGKKKNKT
jgi:hypothetical protein